MKRLLLLFFLMLSASAFNAAAFANDDCEDELGCIEIANGEKIVVGGLLRLSGPRPWSGEVARKAIHLALLARDSKVLDREVELVIEDSACSEDQAREAARRIVSNPEIVGVIGTNCSLAAKGALPVISEAGLLMISPSNSSPFLTNTDREAGGLYQPGYFRTSHNDLFVGALSAQFAATVLKVDLVATIDDGDPYTLGLASAMAEAFAGLDGEVVYRGRISRGTSDVRDVLRGIADSGADLVYFPVFADEAQVITEQLVNTPGLGDTFMMAADGVYSAYFVQNTGEAAIGVFVAAPHIAGDAYAAFLDTWRQEFGEEVPANGFHAHGYDAANLLFDVLESVATERDDGTLVIGRMALRAALTAVEDYRGLTGSLTCREESPFAGDCGAGESLAIYRLTAAEVNDGQWPPPVVWTASMTERD